MRPSTMTRALLVMSFGACASVPPTAAPASKAAPPDAEPAAVTLDRPHGIPGEVMEFVLEGRGITVGRVVTTVGQPGQIDDRPAIIVRSRATSEGLLATFAEYVGEMTTTIDLERGTPLSMSKEEWIVLNGKPDHNTYARTWHDGDHHDPHSAAAVLRGWLSQPGDRGQLTVGWSSNAIEVAIVDAGREIMPDGNRPAVRYDGIAKQHTFSVWISDDVARVPLLMRANTKWGSVSAALVHYEAPRN